MNILLVGAGGREHALAWKLRQSPLVSKLYTAPGNGGTAQEGENIPLADRDLKALVKFSQDHGVDLVVVGPEAPLVDGLAEALAQANIACFGPDSFAARLEGSKSFAKDLMRQTGVPTADYAVFDNFASAKAHVLSRSAPMVVKADGLAAGKGVVVAKTQEQALEALEEMMVARVFGPAGDKVVIEDCLQGEEASFLVFCDGERLAPMPSCQDHKAVGENDTGPNTGGMGAYSPAPILPEDQYEAMCRLAMAPITQALAAQGHPFRGVLYAGLMFTGQGPLVLEYNVRFGDPECQPLLMRLESDLARTMLDCATGRLDPAQVRWSPKTALCVVLAAKGYPGAYPKGMVINGLAEAEKDPLVKAFVAGAAMGPAGLAATGGRVLGVTALGDGLAQAKDRAYTAVSAINFENSYFRRDIGAKGLKKVSA